MSMTKAELMKVFRDAASAEFADYSSRESDYTYEFSDRFERRMDRLIRAESRATWRFFNTNPRRLIIIAVAIVMVLSAVACAVPEIRESIAGFLIRMFSDRADISSPDVSKVSIDDEYKLAPIPEGFSVTGVRKSLKTLIIEYHDENNNLLVLRQIADNDNDFSIDNESKAYSEYVVNEKRVLISHANDYALAVWAEDGYLFYLAYPSTVDLSQFESWITSVRDEL